MKFGTNVYYTKTSKFSYSAKPDDVWDGCGGNFAKWPMSQKLRGREASILTLYTGLVGRRFQKKYCWIHRDIASVILEAILKHGGHFLSIKSISETMMRRAFNIDSMYRNCGVSISEKALPNTSCHCIRHVGGHLKNGGHFQNNTTYLGKYKTENRHSGST